MGSPSPFARRPDETAEQQAERIAAWRLRWRNVHLFGDRQPVRRAR